MDWIETLRSGNKRTLWADFQPATVGEITMIEEAIHRKLPDDFREFYQSIGYGYWKDFGGDIYAPWDILGSLAAPVYFVLGSLTPGEEWATLEEHRELWLSRGRKNPAQQKFTQELFFFKGLNLLDLLQIGTDGCCGYQMLHLSSSSKIGYVLVNDSFEIEFPTTSFREGITMISDWILARSSDDYK